MMNIENIANFLFFTSSRLMYDGGVFKDHGFCFVTNVNRF